jgi:hypothetical protein
LIIGIDTYIYNYIIVSPEYKNIKKTPKHIKDILTSQLSRKQYERGANEGIFVVDTINGFETRVWGDMPVSAANHLRDQAGYDSCIHYVRGLKESTGALKRLKSLEIKFGGMSSDEAMLSKGKSSSKFRGKHRSQTKGVGLIAFFRNKWMNRYKQAKKQ